MNQIFSSLIIHTAFHCALSYERKLWSILVQHTIYNQDK